MRVTNQTLYNEIQVLKGMKAQVKINTWIASTAFTLSIGMILGSVIL